MTSIIKFFDMFGGSFTPTVGNSEKQTSILGGLFGLSYWALAVYLFCDFGEVLIYKNTPFLITQAAVDKNTSQIFNMELSYNISITPNHEYFKTKAEEDTQLEIIQGNIDRLFKIFMYYKSPDGNEEIGMRKCNVSKFDNILSDEVEMFKELSCIDDRKKTYNLTRRFNDPLGKVITIEIYQCENTTKSNTCYSEAWQNELIKMFNFQIVYVYNEVTFQPSNFNKPFSSYLDWTRKELILYPYPINQVIKVELEQSTVTTDKGLFKEDAYNTTGHSVSSIQLVLLNFRKIRCIDDVIRKQVLSTIIYTSMTSNYYKRSYPKVQDILANVTGFVGLLGLAFQIFLQKIYDSKTRELILHQLFQIDQDLIAGEKEYDCTKSPNANEKAIVGNADQVVLEVDQQVLQFDEKTSAAGMSHRSLIKPRNLIGCGGNIELEYIREEKRTTYEPESSSVGKRKSRLSGAFNKKARNSSLEVKSEKREGTTRFSSIALTRLQELKSLNKEITKEKYSYIINKSNLIGFWGHLFMTYFSCCLCGKLRKIHYYYSDYDDFVTEYTDVLNITNSLREIEKLKYLLFDEDQIALFNTRTRVTLNCLGKNTNKFSDYFYFTKDLNDDLDFDLIKASLLNRSNQRKINERLVGISN